MKKIILTFHNIKTKRKLHKYLKTKLDLPEHYGNNLDALFDCLTDIEEPTVVGIFPEGSDKSETDTEFSAYLDQMKKVFYAAERENEEYLAVLSEDDLRSEGRP